MEYKKTKAFADKVVEFIKSKKSKFIEKNEWYSGGTVAVYPIMKWYHDNGDVTINVQLTGCDQRNFNGFENVLKNHFEYVDYAYYSKSDGSGCPNQYTIRLKFPKK